ncbi:hypothetical protein DNTS_032895 [Danionella cerebrum]|nr:hypothetical protein DNTS_032895 [Danionella translucida]
MGDTITLSCNMKGRNAIAWYHQNSEELKLLISAEKHKTGSKLDPDFISDEARLKLVHDMAVYNVSLVISQATKSDLGLYFCGTNSDLPEMHFDKPIRVQDHQEETMPEEDCSKAEELTQTERGLMFSGIALAFLAFFVTTVIAGGTIHRRGWQKGFEAAERNSLKE